MDSQMDDDILPDDIQIQRHWTRWMYTTCCYLSNLDSQIEHEGIINSLLEFTNQNKVKRKRCKNFDNRITIVILKL
jgi:hypothetical protein